MVVIRRFQMLPRCEADYKRLPPDLKKQAKEAICKLIDCGIPPFPLSLRFEKLHGYKNPNIYTIHLTSNHSHKASFELRGDIAVFRQIGTHKELDRNP